MLLLGSVPPLISNHLQAISVTWCESKRRDRERSNYKCLPYSYIACTCTPVGKTCSIPCCFSIRSPLATFLPRVKNLFNVGGWISYTSWTCLGESSTHLVNVLPQYFDRCGSHNLNLTSYSASFIATSDEGITEIWPPCTTLSITASTAFNHLLLLTSWLSLILSRKSQGLLMATITRNAGSVMHLAHVE